MSHLRPVADRLRCHEQNHYQGTRRILRGAALGLAAALFFISCAFIRSDLRSATVANFQDYAALLRELDRHSEAAEMEARAARLRQAFQNPYPTPVGFDPVGMLREYAALLKSQGKDGEAEELEELAVEYHRANVMHFQRSAFQKSQAGKLLGDRLIVPGERIGRLELGDRLEEVVSLLGTGVSRGQGFQAGTTIHTWDPIGLWLIADDSTGIVLWISVEGGPSASPNFWIELSTREGLRLGSTEEEVLAVMGNPARTASDGVAKSLHFDQRGIRFTLPLRGPMAGKVAALRVVPPGTQP